MPAVSTSVLDNPIWHALSTRHSQFAIGNEVARQFEPGIGPLGGIVEPSAANFRALSEVVSPGGVVALFLESELDSPKDWAAVHTDVLYQMIGERPLKLVEPIDSRKLTAADVPQMVALAELTEPGPFRDRTIELGYFVGVFRDTALAAMSGERLKLPGLTEVSAVCTHPNHRGNGYARALMSEGIQNIFDRGETPFLHVRTSNRGAIALYESLGLSIRRTLYLAVLRNESR